MAKHLLPRVLYTIAVLFLFQTATAQTRFGIMGGAGKTSLFKFPYSPEDFDRYKGTGSFWGGLHTDIPVNKKGLSVYVNAIYNQRGFKYSQLNDTGAVNTIKDSAYQQKLNYADLHLLLVKKIINVVEDETVNNGFFVGTGPSFSFLISGTETASSNYFGGARPSVNSSNSNLKGSASAGSYQSMFAGWMFVAGVEINKFKIWGTANFPLGTYFTDTKKSVPHKLKTFGITAGYLLFTHVKKEKPVKQVPYTPVASDSTKDSDGDGILDINDKCPGHAGVARYQGCPVPDTDGDGIDDENDRCPLVAGTAANNGCPVIMDTVKISTPDTTRFTIYFEPAKSILRGEGFNVLNQVVNMMKANPKLVVLFKGHTDNAGTQEANFKRSLERVTICANYIASFYIDRKRISTASYGNTQPAADLNDPLLQWKNRRVEVCLFEKNE